MSKDSASIQFFSDGIFFKLINKRKIANWLKSVANNEGKKIDKLAFTFVSDKVIYEMNVKFLNHNYFTDIITFDYSTEKAISGEMFISIDTVKNNSIEYNVDFDEELFRVMVHGLLHLCGYKDDTDDEQSLMREIEAKYLKLGIRNN